METIKYILRNALPAPSARKVQRVARKVQRLATLPPAIAWLKLCTHAAGGTLGRIYIDLNHDPRRSALVAGVHRSGSTWLGDVVNAGLRYRLVFEPVRHSRRGETLRAFDRVYVRPEEEQPELRREFEALLSGRRRNYLLDRLNRRLLCRGRLLKEVSGSLLLKWFRTQFPFVPIVYIVRNPLLVVSSCLRMDWLSPREPEFWLGQPALVEDHLAPFRGLIAAARSKAEKYALEWCICNFVALRQFGDGEWKLVFYDDLVRDPEPQLRAVFDYLSAPFGPAVLKKVTRPSHTTEENLDRASMLEKWRARLDPPQQQAIERYAREFGLERYLGR